MKMELTLHKPDPLFSVKYVSRDYTWQMPKYHYHKEYEIYILERGTRSVFIDESFFRIEPYTVMLFKPNISHRSAGEAFSRTSVYFSEDFLDLYFSAEAKKLLLKCFDTPIMQLGIAEFSKLKKITLKMSSENIKNNDNFIFSYLSEMLTILSEMPLEASIAQLPEKNKLIDDIILYIDKNYLNISDLSQISNQFLITKNHLCRIFKNYTNLTVISYINLMKIQLSCDKLINTSKSVTDIAFECGFNSAMYFDRIFKRIMNMSPQDFRKEFAAK